MTARHAGALGAELKTACRYKLIDSPFESASARAACDIAETLPRETDRPHPPEGGRGRRRVGAPGRSATQGGNGRSRPRALPPKSASSWSNLSASTLLAQSCARTGASCVATTCNRARRGRRESGVGSPRARPTSCPSGLRPAARRERRRGHPRSPNCDLGVPPGRCTSRASMCEVCRSRQLRSMGLPADATTSTTRGLVGPER